MLHLRLIVPPDLTAVVVERLGRTPGATHIACVPGAATVPGGDLVICDVAREAANDVVEWLQDEGVHHRGAITLEVLEAAVSDAAEAAEASAPGHGGDALVWEELEARSRDDAALTVSFAAFMMLAAVIAGVGILLDSPVLVIGAMAAGPDYGPLTALCIAAVRRRWDPAWVASTTIFVGLLLATMAALVATTVFRLTTAAPDAYDLTDRELTAFISHPDAMAAIVAFLAGVLGMLAVTEARTGTLVGVLVSVTTIPAAANIGVACAYGDWAEVGGAALQLMINVVALVVAGVLTLFVHARMTKRRHAQ